MREERVNQIINNLSCSQFSWHDFCFSNNMASEVITKFTTNTTGKSEPNEKGRSFQSL